MSVSFTPRVYTLSRAFLESDDPEHLASIVLHYASPHLLIWNVNRGEHVSLSSSAPRRKYATVAGLEEKPIEVDDDEEAPAAKKGRTKKQMDEEEDEEEALPPVPSASSKRSALLHRSRASLATMVYDPWHLSSTSPLPHALASTHGALVDGLVAMGGRSVWEKQKHFTDFLLRRVLAPNQLPHAFMYTVGGGSSSVSAAAVSDSGAVVAAASVDGVITVTRMDSCPHGTRVGDSPTDRRDAEILLPAPLLGMPGAGAWPRAAERARPTANAPAGEGEPGWRDAELARRLAEEARAWGTSRPGILPSTAAPGASPIQGSAGTLGLSEGDAFRHVASHRAPPHMVAELVPGAALRYKLRDAVNGWTGRSEAASHASADPLRLVGHRGRVLSVRVSSDDTMLLSTGADGSLRVWDLLTGRVVVDARLPSPAVRAEWSPLRAHVAALSVCGSVTVLRVTSATPSVYGLFEAASAPSAVRAEAEAAAARPAAAPGTAAAVVDAHQALGMSRRFPGDPEAGLELWRSVAWHPNGCFLLLGGSDGSLVVGTGDGVVLSSTPLCGRSPIVAVAVSPCGSLIAAGDEEGMVCLCVLDGVSGSAEGGATPVVLQILSPASNPAHDGPVTALAFSACSSVLASGDGSGAVALWHVLPLALEHAERRRAVAVRKRNREFAQQGTDPTARAAALELRTGDATGDARVLAARQQQQLQLQHEHEREQLRRRHHQQQQQMQQQQQQQMQAQQQQQQQQQQQMQMQMHGQMHQTPQQQQAQQAQQAQQQLHAQHQQQAQQLQAQHQQQARQLQQQQQHQMQQHQGGIPFAADKIADATGPESEGRVGSHRRLTETTVTRAEGALAEKQMAVLSAVVAEERRSPGASRRAFSLPPSLLLGLLHAITPGTADGERGVMAPAPADDAADEQPFRALGAAAGAGAGDGAGDTGDREGEVLNKPPRPTGSTFAGTGAAPRRIGPRRPALQGELTAVAIALGLEEDWTRPYGPAAGGGDSAASGPAAAAAASAGGGPFRVVEAGLWQLAQALRGQATVDPTALLTASLGSPDEIPAHLRQWCHAEMRRSLLVQSLAGEPRWASFAEMLVLGIIGPALEEVAARVDPAVVPLSVANAAADEPEGGDAAAEAWGQDPHAAESNLHGSEAKDAVPTHPFLLRVLRARRRPISHLRFTARNLLLAVAVYDEEAGGSLVSKIPL